VHLDLVFFGGALNSKQNVKEEDPKCVPDGTANYGERPNSRERKNSQIEGDNLDQK